MFFHSNSASQDPSSLLPNSIFVSHPFLTLKTWVPKRRCRLTIRFMLPTVHKSTCIHHQCHYQRDFQERVTIPCSSFQLLQDIHWSIQSKHSGPKLLEFTFSVLSQNVKLLHIILIKQIWDYSLLFLYCFVYKCFRCLQDKSQFKVLKSFVS